MQGIRKRKADELDQGIIIIKDIVPVSPLVNKRIECKFNEYLLNMFEDYHDFFREWDLSRIYSERRLWQLEDEFIYIYIIVQSVLFENDEERKLIKTSGKAADSYIGITKDINASIRKYNEKPPQSKKGTKADYKILLYCIVPPFRNFSSIPIKKICKIGRSWSSKCKKLISISTELKLQWKIAPCILNTKSPFFNKGVFELIRKLIPNIENSIIDSSSVNFPILED